MPAVALLGSDFSAFARCLRSRSAKCGEQLCFLRLRGFQMPVLDVAVTADVLGNLRQLDREIVVVGCECCNQLVEEHLVLAVRPKTSNAGPRRTRIFASTRNAPIIHGP